MGIIIANIDYHVIVINGKPNSGKDLVVKIFTDIVTGNKKNASTLISVFNLSTIDEIKNIAEDCFEWNEVKDEKGRKLLHDLKKAAKEYNNLPFKIITKRINRHIRHYIKKTINVSFQNKYLLIFFVHSREPEEIMEFKNEYKEKCSTLLVSSVYSESYNNSSDKNVDDFQYDYIISNRDNIETLEKEVKEYICNNFVFVIS